MISRIEKAWRGLRRALNRSEWLTRILKLHVADEGPHRTGLVMIQIDGLSHGELRKAIAGKEMPFLNRLIEREHYELREMYSGVPSTTSAVQGELFYGIRQATAGFCFLDRESGELVTMIEPEMARKVEQELEQRSDMPLLSGGSGYANNYTGGADEPHFCPTAKGWGSAVRQASPLAVMALIITNVFSFLRMAVLACVEAVLAVVDLVRGVLGGKNFFLELKFVPVRIAITVLLREFSVIGAKIDVVRGLPIIHLNLLGYDEQAHRRGPKSRFAHWTLKGIDAAIKRIWKATLLSKRRHYELWVYSDHGQETAVPYVRRHGRSFGEAVSEVFSAHAGREVSFRLGSPWGAQLHRAGHLGTRIWNRLVPRRNGWAGEEEEEDDLILSIAALGPVAMIYWDEDLNESSRTTLARRLAEDAKAPTVLFPNGEGTVKGWMGDRPVRLPDDGAEVVGPDHPHQADVIADLVQLCHHKNAGDFVALGISGGRQPTLTFSVENGAHGGIGPAETSAFSLVPGDTEFMPQSNRMRIRDLRNAALGMRGRLSHEVFGAGSVKRSQPRTLRLVTYNVHSCVGMDGRLSPQRIARVIARCEPDVVCLQELDMHRPRSGGVDQAHRIAQALDMDFHFHPALHIEEEKYGDAVLTHLPMKLVRAGALPHWKNLPGTEPRGALWVEIEVAARRVQIINTHLGVRARDRRLQVEALLGPDWLAHPACREPLVVCGDFNALPHSYVHRQLSRQMRDVQRAMGGHRPKPTFAGHFPTARIDHVFVDSSVEVLSIEVPANQLSRLASDHLPLIAELRLS